MKIHSSSLKKASFTLLILISFISISLHSSAQGGFRVGGMGGAGVTMLYNADWQADATQLYFPTLSGYGGVNFGYNMNYYNMGFTFGLFFKGFNHKQIGSGGVGNEWTRISRATYIDMPILFHIRPAGDKVSRTITYGGGYFEIGIQPSFLMGANDFYENDALGISTTTNTKTFFETTVIGAVLGFGIHQVGTRNVSVTHGLRMYYGLTDAIGDKNYIAPGATATTNQVSVKYLFGVQYKFGGNGGRRRR